MAVGVRGALEAGDVKDDDVVTLDDVRHTIAILGHLKEGRIVKLHTWARFFFVGGGGGTAEGKRIFAIYNVTILY